jgi:hypothetical protein
VRRKDFRSDYETFEKGFQMRKDNARAVDYHNLGDDHILRLAIARGYSAEPDKGPLGELRQIEDIVTQLCVDDFETFTKQTIGTREPTTGVSRLEAYEKARTISTPHIAVRVALFASATNPWNLSKEVLQWIIYLSNDKYNMSDVWRMSKSELAFNRKHIASDLPNRAILRKDVELLMGDASHSRASIWHTVLC